MIYDNKMDQECIELCDTINRINGLKTIGSCSGHELNDFWIAFEVENYNKFLQLFSLACMNGFNWEMMPSDFNLNLDVPEFFVLGCKYKGERAYLESNKLSKKINNDLLEIRKEK